ncbi:hypothetical protein LTS18_010256 [Coniosporium uncinatum]|uniref:Uncharacterized protein n=1 Tax=Coniosporium uncinatum TaxID=93489 RepID=A0ACC3DCI5_9PEZI|nr:hypothetical protein LTS18_010256 [Coniosporium uncinatum]
MPPFPGGMDNGKGFPFGSSVNSWVEIKSNYINFKAGEHPKLPFEGHKLLVFSSKISGYNAANMKVDSYINTMISIAQAHFGSRIRCWHEGADVFGTYDWNEVNESLESYEQVRHTRVGRRKLATEWRVETDWEMKEPKQPKPALGQHGTA